MKRMAIVAAIGMASSTLWAATLTVQNFDDDLATVYVNDVATTNGQKVAVDGSVKIELRDFRNDYYFRYAPASQTDRTLALDCWEGVPEGYEKANPATFDVGGDLTITPNVDVKGFCWTLDTETRRIDDGHFCWGCGGTASNYKNDALRTIRLGVCVTNWWVTEENSRVVDHVLDCVERVRYDGKNYTICGLYESYCFNYSRVGTLVVPPKCGFYVTNLTYGDKNYAFVTNVVGFYDLTTAEIGDATFFRPCAGFSGPATNVVPRRVVKVGTSWPFGNVDIIGEMLLESIKTIGWGGFAGHKQLTSVRFMSSDLTSIGDTAFNGCTALTDVTFAGSLSKWTTLSATAFDKTVTNYTFFVNPPGRSILDNMLSAHASSDGAHLARLIVDPSLAKWWSHVSEPKETEVGAGLPENCMGVYVTAAGDRKAWVVGTTPLGGILLVGDMSMVENDGFVPRTGLEIGSRVVLEAPDGYDQCKLQHIINGQWDTYDTISGSSVNYEHEGQLTRAVWGIDGAVLRTNVVAYGGHVTTELVSGEEVSPGIYKKGSVVRLTASGSATHPTSHFIGWTSGIDAAQAGEASVEVTLNDDLDATADFYPDEWTYTSATQISDGEWTVTSSTLTGDELSINNVSGGQNGILCLDLSLPVHPANDQETTYVFTALNCRPDSARRLKLGTRFYFFKGQHYTDSTILEDIFGLGASSVINFPYAFLCRCSGSPLHAKVYEANDFVPPGLQTMDAACDLSGAPYLKGTLELNAAKTFYDDVNKRANAFGGLNALLWNTTLDVGVTNLLLTTEEPTNIPDVFSKAHVESVTLGMTNLLVVSSDAFYRYLDKGNYWSTIKDLTFLAHAPTASALDNILYFSGNTNTTIYCSKFAPGWKQLRMANYTQQPEWPARPAGTWGMYQTTTGYPGHVQVRRFYLVQKDSKYDKRNGFAVILK